MRFGLTIYQLHDAFVIVEGSQNTVVCYISGSYYAFQLGFIFKQQALEKELLLFPFDSRCIWFIIFCYIC